MVTVGAYRVRQPTSNPNVYENQQNERNHRHPQPPIGRKGPYH